MIRQTKIDGVWYALIPGWFGEVPEQILPYVIRGSGSVGDGSYMVEKSGEHYGPYSDGDDAAIQAIWLTKDDGEAVISQCLLRGDNVKLYRALSRVDHRGELESLVDRMVNCEEYLINLGYIEKAIDPNTPEGLETYVVKLNDDWDETLDPIEEEYVEFYSTFIEEGDWEDMTEEEVERAFGQAGMWIPPRTAEAIVQMSQQGFDRSIEISEDIRKGQVDEGLEISTSLSLEDTNTVRLLNQNAAKLMPESFRKWSADIADKMWNSLVKGVEQGLPLSEITDEIVKQLPDGVHKRQKQWTSVAAHSAIGRARSFSLLSSYRDGGLREIIYRSVLDEVTTPTCVFLDGKVIEVEQAFNYHKDSLESDKGDLIEDFPWVQIKKPAKEGTLLVVTKGGEDIVLAQELPGGEMEWTDNMSMREATALGVHPPTHPRCRSTTVSRLV